jgi:hypothetical protein
MPAPPDWPERQDALNEEEVARYRELEADWSALLETLTGDLEFGRKVVEADSVAQLSRWFTAAGGWRAEEDRWGLLGENAFGVAWQWDGIHDVPFAFNGLPASDRPVTVLGFTLMGPDPLGSGRVLIRRYVDWAGVFGQLGLPLNWRIPVPP